LSDAAGEEITIVVCVCLQWILYDVAFHHNITVKRKKQRLIVLMALDSPVDLYADDTSDTAALRQYLS